LMILLIGASNILVIYIGGLQYINGQIELGILAEFIIYVTMLTWPVATVGWVTSIVQQAEASQKRINEFLKSPVRIEKKSLRKKEVLGKIEFKNVSFTYKETNIEALKNISFVIKPGESIAIMGDVGSGKSTILELISGVYKPTEGKIIVDNLDLNNYNTSDFRNSIGYVPQTTFLFSDTIENNIKFGKHEATYEELINSSKSSCLHDDILSFDKKYKTLLGERGVNLSGGQKQRLSIARAIIKKPKILLLDDSLSAVDTETEEKIISNINSITKNITVFITTHRISTSKKCDKILMLKDGSIESIGSHKELMKEKKSYFSIFNKQSKEIN